MPTLRHYKTKPRVSQPQWRKGGREGGREGGRARTDNLAGLLDTQQAKRHQEGGANTDPRRKDALERHRQGEQVQKQQLTDLHHVRVRRRGVDDAFAGALTISQAVQMVLEGFTSFTQAQVLVEPESAQGVHMLEAESETKGSIADDAGDQAKIMVLVCDQGITRIYKQMKHEKGSEPVGNDVQYHQRAIAGGGHQIQRVFGQIRFEGALLGAPLDLAVSHTFTFRCSQS